VDAAILAGGRARRFGGADKSALLVGRRTILERQLDALDGLVDRVFVVTTGERERFEGLGLRIVPDHIGGAGALGGLYTALAEAESAYVLVLACDLPFVGASLLKRIASLAVEPIDAAIPRTSDGIQPLCAVYARRLVETVRRQIESSHLKVQELLEAIRVRELSPDDIAALDADGRSFFNVNTPDDLEQAVRLAAGADRRAGR
jgi:molybdenum cofactor guanylyltransferase